MGTENGIKPGVFLAEKKDIPRLLELLRLVNNVHSGIRPDLFIENRTKYEAQTLEEMLGDVSAPILVAKDGNGRVLGYLFARLQERSGPNLTGGKSFYIDDLCVDAACQRQGVGGLLLEHARKFAAELGCRELLLNVWEGNDSARVFYESRGFRPRSHLMEFSL